MSLSGQLVLATRSVGKLRELRSLLAGSGLRLIDLDEAGVPEGAAEDALEAYATFEENAVAKARYFSRLTGLPAIADDSGLEVRALGGRPGVNSKRWSAHTGLSGIDLDEANNARLVAELRGETDRRARYVCVAAFHGEGRDIIRRGEVEGVLVDSPRGEHGFGYDPYFLCDELGKTFGEAGEWEKQGVSHRARAFVSLVAALRETAV